ncbi:MAG: O-antigen ligase family protein [Oscillospiraceae bacterium]|nr:O-antigen ligase family protein [Oscillospiraceae bacterium]
MTGSSHIFSSLKDKLTSGTGNFVFILLVIQPILDAVSYWTNVLGVTYITTVLRFIMFILIVLYCFIISDRKKAYYILVAVLIVYWIIHMVACFIAGYEDPVSDFAYYLRAIHMPVLAVCFITCFKKSDELPRRIQLAFIYNLVAIIAIVLLSYITGTQHYTYDIYKIGIIGWVAVDNCQSAIICLIVPLILYYTYRLSKLSFAVCSVVCFAQMYFFSTRLAYMSIFLIAGGMIVAFLINKEKRLFYYGVLALVIIVAAGCFKLSPMYVVRASNGDNFDERQGWAEVTIQKSREALVTETGKDPEPLDYDLFKDLYEFYLSNMIDRFGLERVVDTYGHTTDVSTLIDQRVAKNTFAAMLWEDCNTFSRLFGMEYKSMVHDGMVYDLENDFDAIFYFYGYIGTAAYALFILYFLFIIIRRLFADFRGTLTAEMCAVGITFGFLLGAAELSGNVLRRPNVSLYLSLIMAYIFYLTVLRPNSNSNKDLQGAA